MKVTDYERIAIVNCNQHGQFECPKCRGICNKSHDLWDCNKCGRGWEQIPNHIITVNQLFRKEETNVKNA